MMMDMAATKAKPSKLCQPNSIISVRILSYFKTGSIELVEVGSKLKLCYKIDGLLLLSKALIVLAILELGDMFFF